MSGQAYKLTKHVYLIGFMGAGKSSVARKLATTCKITELDVDTYIERNQRQSISDIFKEGGEDAFRKIESSTLKTLSELSDPLLISCGGGIVERPENIDILKKSGIVIHLLVDADEAASRIADTSSRPLFNDLERARKLQASRFPKYEKAADITIDTKGKNIYELTDEVTRALREAEILCPLH